LASHAPVVTQLSAVPCWSMSTAMARPLSAGPSSPPRSQLRVLHGPQWPNQVVLCVPTCAHSYPQHGRLRTCVCVWVLARRCSLSRVRRPRSHLAL
jgi:hypothetical protein